MISAIVLAAGTSSRMKGPNKLLLPLSGRPLIHHVIESVAASSAAEVVVVTGHESARVQPALAGFDVTIAYNPQYARGQTGSVRVGVRAAHADALAYMICLGDLPLISTSDYDRVIALFRSCHASDPNAVVRPTYRGIPGHPVVFSGAWRTYLTSETASTGCRNVLRRHAEHVTEMEWVTDHVVRDVDTPETYRATLAAL